MPDPNSEALAFLAARRSRPAKILAGRFILRNGNCDRDVCFTKLCVFKNSPD